MNDVTSPDLSAAELARQGLVQRNRFRDEVPDVVASVCFEWHDGPRTAMYQFAICKPVRPSALVREVDKCIEVNNQGPKVAGRLAEARRWLVQQETLCRAGKALFEAADAAGMDACDGGRFCEVMLKPVGEFLPGTGR